MDRGVWQATVHGTQRVGHNLATKQRQSLLGHTQQHLHVSMVKDP